MKQYNTGYFHILYKLVEPTERNLNLTFIPIEVETLLISQKSMAKWLHTKRFSITGINLNSYELNSKEHANIKCFPL